MAFICEKLYTRKLYSRSHYYSQSLCWKRSCRNIFPVVKFCNEFFIVIEEWDTLGNLFTNIFHNNCHKIDRDIPRQMLQAKWELSLVLYFE